MLLFLLALGGLVSPRGVASQGAAADDAIADDAYFYGQSPPVYPSPEIVGREWADACARARALVAKMTLAEKVSLTGGAVPGSGCSGVIAPIERLGFPGLCLSDAGNGLRATDLVNGYPSGIHAGASWNKELAYQRGAAMGGEFRRKGVNVLLGPVVGPIGRVVRGGRNWEGFSVDPYLSGALVSATVRGIQGQGVVTSVKHFIANEQESYRNPGGDVEAVSSNIDDKTMHQLYLWPFQDAIKAGAGNIMCSYQRVNNSYGCANSKTLNGLLKTELGFQGFVVSDWSAQHAGVATALAGLDMAMPSGDPYWGKSLVEAVQNGSVAESRVDDMATRILTTWYQFGQDSLFKEPGVGMPKDVTEPHEAVEGREAGALPVLRQGAVEGHVLVKNTEQTLPLKAPRMLSLFGYSARSPDMFAPVAGTNSRSQLWMFGKEQIDLTEGMASSPASKADVNNWTIGVGGTLVGGCGSGAITPAVFTAPFEALKVRAARQDVALMYDFVSSEPAVDPLSDACVVFGNAWACEGYDRPAIYDNYTDSLVRSVADQCARTIVVLHNAGVRLVDGFADHANVTAIMLAHLPGRDSGEALVSLLFGDVSPSGKLPYTVARKDADYGHVLAPDRPEGQFLRFPQSDFAEGADVDYRWFDRHGIEPRYAFGFGLSYTTFGLSGLHVGLVPDVRTAAFPAGPVAAGGPTDLWDVLATVDVGVANTGPVAGAEVVQVYVGIPGEAGRQLRGFEKPFLQPGERRIVSIKLTRRDLSVWDTDAQQWRLQRGRYEVHVGTSSRHLPLRGCVDVEDESERHVVE